MYYNHHPLRQWDYPIEQFDQSLKKCTVLLLWDERVVCVDVPSLSFALRYCVTEHNASGRKWICSFKWCMGSFWTPFCGQEWSSLNYCKWNQLLLGLPLLRLSLYLLPSYSSLGAEILLLSQQLLQFHPQPPSASGRHLSTFCPPVSHHDAYQFTLIELIGGLCVQGVGKITYKCAQISPEGAPRRVIRFCCVPILKKTNSCNARSIRALAAALPTQHPGRFEPMRRNDEKMPFRSTA